MKILKRILLYIVIAAAILYIGFWACLFLAFSANEFYVWITLACILLLLVFTFLHCFRLVSAKRMKKVWLIYVAIIIAACTLHAVRDAYSKKFAKMRENDVDLRSYLPYGENTRVAHLDTLSTLRFEADSSFIDATSYPHIQTNLPQLDGATALYPVYAAFAQAVYPPKEYLFDSEVRCERTNFAYQRLINKQADIIFVAKPSGQQLEMAKQAGVSFHYTPVGREAFVFFVNSNNPVDNLTVDQLQGIYSGKITNWQEVGGSDDRIRPFQRNENSGSQTVFISFMQGKNIPKPPMEDIPGDMGGMVRQTADYANYGNAIGFSFRFYVNEMDRNIGVKVLKVNGVYPDVEAIGSGAYPLASPFFAVTLADNDKPNVQKLLDWMVSEQGQYLVEKTGYCPIK